MVNFCTLVACIILSFTGLSYGSVYPVSDVVSEAIGTDEGWFYQLSIDFPYEVSSSIDFFSSPLCTKHRQLDHALVIDGGPSRYVICGSRDSIGDGK